MKDSEVIVEVGVEGGSISLLGKRGINGFIFWMGVNDSTAELLDAEDQIDLV